MTEEGAKLVTDDPGIPDRDVSDEPLDTKRPIALSGDTHEHLENQDGAAESNKIDGAKKR
jgi:hypothetical protein